MEFDRRDVLGGLAATLASGGAFALTSARLALKCEAGQGEASGWRTAWANRPR